LVFIVCIFCGSKGTILLLKMNDFLARQAPEILAGELGFRLQYDDKYKNEMERRTAQKEVWQKQ
jgi:hypothetical protein